MLSSQRQIVYHTTSSSLLVHLFSLQSHRRGEMEYRWSLDHQTDQSVLYGVLCTLARGFRLKDALVEIRRIRRSQAKMPLWQMHQYAEVRNLQARFQGLKLKNITDKLSRVGSDFSNCFVRWRHSVEWGSKRDILTVSDTWWHHKNPP